MRRNQQEDAEKAGEDLLAALGRFSEPALFILVSLADGPKHGYAMTQDIEAVSGQKLGAGHALRGDRAARGPQVDRGLARRGSQATLPAHDGGPAGSAAPLEHLRAVARVGQARLAGARMAEVERLAMTTAEGLLRLYPRAWRDRYGEEFLATVGDDALHVQQMIDIVMGAIDAWLSLDVRRAASSYSTVPMKEDRPCSSP